ncbi:hypothetical protein AYL99_11989 [Fonsecaea erecta]|uniref:FAD-binding FR-type domain-containing protein n=1 Tax=Fonsecaea erecta TaxID=1367422 RepID=A0A178Z3L6_9EURO|nr:hypothetical protein AYL99_11989 [Fonsecaea erecta]OAP53803.1 hypothetical protein AYL99_11989 [Fonsecaea erecta]
MSTFIRGGGSGCQEDLGFWKDDFTGHPRTASSYSREGFGQDHVPLKPSFQRKTRYVQQQDLRLPFSTVREVLHFPALLRQPAPVPQAEKFEYVKVIEALKCNTSAMQSLGWKLLTTTHADAQRDIHLLPSRLEEGEGEGLLERDVDVYITSVSSSSTTGPVNWVVAPRVSMRKMKEDIINVRPLGHRPSLGSIVDEVLNSSSSSSPYRGERVPLNRDDEATVFVCGPRTLSRDLRALVGRRV